MLYRNQVKDVYPLTPMQEGMLFHYLLDKSSPVYYRQIAFQIPGKIDRGLFEKAFNRLVERYDVLRTIFIHDQVKKPLQLVLKERIVKVYYEDISHLSDAARSAYLEEFKRKDKKTGFDLSKDIPMRFSLLKLSTERYEILWTHHHIIMDGWCSGLLLNELISIYHRLGAGHPLDLPPVPQYGTYIRWLERQNLPEGLHYWKKYLEDYEQPAVIPQIKEGSENAYRQIKYTFRIPKEDTGKLNRIAETNNLTLSTVLQCLWGILLGVYNNTTDVVFGVVVSGRPLEIPGIERMIGLFINTIPVRIAAGEDPTFTRLVRDLQAGILRSGKYDYTSLVEIQALTPLKQKLFDHILVFENYPLNLEDGTQPTGTPAAAGPGWENVESYEQSSYNLDVVITPGQELTVTFRCNSLVYAGAVLERTGKHLAHMIRQVAAAPGLRLSEIVLLDEAEKNRLLYDFNDTAADYPPGETLPKIFARQAEKRPEATALILANHPQRTTYRQLNREVHRLARLLRNRGTGPDRVTAIILEPCLEMIAGILAILKAGGAYLPIDPGYPPERLKYILRDSHTHLVLTGKKLGNQLGPVILNENIELIEIHTPAPEGKDPGENGTTDHLPCLNRPTDLAYIIYTSGTTGQPKGVMIRHENVVRLLFNRRFQFDFDDRDLWTMFHAYNFDFSVWEMYGALLYGGKLVLIPKMTARDPKLFLDLLAAERVTVLNQVPSAFYSLSAEMVKRCGPAGGERRPDLRLRYVIFGGEALKPLMLKEWKARYPQTRLINMFGITETTVHVTYKEIGSEEIRTNSSSLGKPLPTTTAYVLGKNLGPLPTGIPGELCVGGKGVARGYMNRPLLTAEKFVPHPYGQPGETLYKSGDLVKMSENGEIEYLGRIDQQVQLRGFRIEPGEIESTLLKRKEIKEAAVITRENQDGDTYLCAYIRAEQEPDLQELRDYLTDRLPAHMIPNYFIPVERFPLTANGKLDWKQLPEPGVKPGQQFTPPGNETETRLAEIWGQLLNVEPVGITDNYFQLGGDSIKAIRLISSINSRFKATLSVGDIYLHQTIAELAAKLNEEAGDTGSKNRLAQEALKELEDFKKSLLHSDKFRQREGIEDLFPMSDIEKGMTFYYLRDSAQAIYHDQPVYQWKYRQFDLTRMRKALALMIEKHPILRTAFEIEETAHLVYTYRESFSAVAYLDISTMEKTKQETFIREYLLDSRKRGFNLARPPLWRLSFIKISPDYMVIPWEFYHAIIDGWSNACFLTELNNTYHRLEIEPGYRPEKLKLGYKEYMIDQLSLKKDETVIAYWKNELLEYKRWVLPKTGRKKELKMHFVDMGIELRERLETAARQHETTLKHLCFAGFLYMQHMLSYENDITTGLVTHSRPGYEDGDKLVGCFLNTVPVRIIIPSPLTWAQFIRLIDDKMNRLKNVDKLSLLEIMHIIGEKTEEQNPIFDSTFNLIDFHVYNELNSERQQKQIESQLDLESYERTNFLLEFTVNAYGKSFLFQGNYSSEFIDEQMMENAYRYFKEVLERFITDTGGLANKSEILSPEEKRQILVEFNAAPGESPGEKTIYRRFERQVQRTPHRVALKGLQHLSYDELGKKCWQLAGALKERHVGRDTIVAVMAERSVEMVIGIFGILKAGAAYLPIDPGYPQERIDFMLKDSGAEILLEADNLSSWLAPAPQAFNNHPKGTSLAYIIYTSGSTGKPKGIMVEQHSIVNLLSALQAAYPFGQEDAYLLKTSFMFDVSITEIFGWFTGGGRLVVLPPGEEKDALAISEIIAGETITHINFVPAGFNAFLEVLDREKAARLSCLNYIFLAGEALSPGTIRRFRSFNLEPAVKLENCYGPTEAAVYASTYSLSAWGREAGGGAGPADSEPVPIGKPLTNVRLYILDRYAQLQPPGVEGELFIGGRGLARGYLNNPELTSERFVFIFNRSYKSYFYRTGDLARWLQDGSIEFLGRIDHQVKIRGFRIEPEEIETQLANHPSIKEAVVTTGAVRAEEAGETYLCAYVVPVNTFNLPELNDYLSRHLPHYMIPAVITPLEKIPLTPSGKIDRKKLPKPELASSSAYTAPRRESEKKLVELWSEVLGGDTLAEAIGIDDNFFEIGGHSLKATILVSKIHKVFNVKVPLAQFFKHRTVRALSVYIHSLKEEHYAAVEPVEKREYYALSSAQKRLYFLQQMNLKSTGYNMALILPLGKEIEKEKRESVLKQLVARHSSLRTSFTLVGDEPVQKIHGPGEVEFRVEDYDIAADSVIRPFDLSRAPLIRSGIIKNPGGNHVWIVDMHHIVSDGTSHSILTRDFLTLYQGNRLEPLRLQYNDFSHWQNALSAGDSLKTQEDYWQTRYRDMKEILPLDLPADYKRPAVFTFAGDWYEFKLEREETVKFKALAAQQGATLYMNILAILNTLFHRYTAQTDIIIGSGIAGRPHHDLQQIIGMFVNTLALRNRPESDKTYQAFLTEVSRSSIDAFENQDLQFEELVDKLAIERDPSRNPLFDISMVVQNFEQELPGQRQQPDQAGPFPRPGGKQDGEEPALPPDLTNKTAKFDLTFFIFEGTDEIDIRIEYYTGIFKPETLQGLARHLKNAIKAVNQNPALRLKDIDILSVQEKNRLLYDFNDTAGEDTQEKSLVRLYAELVERHPDQVALMEQIPNPKSQIPNNSSITYRELDEQANRLANYLALEKHLQPEEAVGILMERSVLLAAALLGVLKAGGAYVPLDPDYPEERLKDIIADASLRLMISRKNKIKTLNRLQWECPGFQSYLCPDSTNVYSEVEEEKSGLMDEKLWEYIGESAPDDITGGGWLTGTTGQPFSREEMDEYGDNILKKLKPLLHKKMRVLEIGCASGITMYRIAPLVGLYYGTDLSRVIIEKNREQIAREGHTNIRLASLPAHEIHRVEEKEFDLVIINSVIQSFHGHNYLRSVIRQVLDLMADQGLLFIGDVMDLDLKEKLINYMNRFKHAHRDKEYKTKTDWSAELFLSRAFFEDLAVEFPMIQGVKFSDKIYTITNELTLFRYDTLLKVDKKAGKNKPLKIKSKHKSQEDGTLLAKFDRQKSCFDPGSTPRHLAYVIYTSGSTGKPKGVMIRHGSIARLVKNIAFIDWGPGSRLLPTGSIAFDISTFEIWAPLLNGAPLVLADKSLILKAEVFEKALYKHRITHLHLIPQLFAQLATQRPTIFARLRYFLVGGDLVRPEPVNEIRKKYSRLKILHMYGPTENTTFSTCFPVEREYEELLPMGKPIANSTAYILDPFLGPRPIGVYGELYTGGQGVARGYLNLPELTQERFLRFSRSERSDRTSRLYPAQKLYRTGDLARWNRDGLLEFAGRIDGQVKIRGYRIETGEIESRLSGYQGVKEAVVAARIDETGDPYLCAYLVPDFHGVSVDEDSTGSAIEISDLKLYLSAKLPGYMIPAVFVTLEKIPLTSTGKVDRKSLPEPRRLDITSDYTAPHNRNQETLARIWGEVLGIEKSHIGLDANFFQLGGHSLKATSLASRIHKELDVQVPLAEIFKAPTIRELSQYIEGAVKDQFAAIEPAEKKEYYALSAAQKRLYILQQMELIGTAYNMPEFIPLSGALDVEKLEHIFKQLFRRHESLRTNFHMIDEEPVQKIQDNVKFAIEHYSLKLPTEFIRPFDFSKAPLLRVGLLKRKETNHWLMLDMHHIITDGASMEILRKEFASLAAGEKLSSLRLRYRDFSEWQNRLLESEVIKKQEAYWLKSFAGEIPVLILPYDYPRPRPLSFDGSSTDFVLDGQAARQLKKIAKEVDATLYMTLLSLFSILLSKLSDQEDIIIGTPIANRRHADLERIIGMFVNTLPIRNFPTGEKTYIQFLMEVKKDTLDVFENQEYQFEDLVEKAAVQRDTSRNPIFDVVFNLLNLSDNTGDAAGPGNRDSYAQEPGLDDKHKDGHRQDTSKYDLNLTAIDFSEGEEKGIYFNLEYCTRLFKADTIEGFIRYFKNIVSLMTDNPEAKLSRIEILSQEEKLRILIEFNQTTVQYPREQTIHQLSALQVKRTPDHTALIGQVLKGSAFDVGHLTYNELNEKATQLAHLLRENGVKPDTILGIMVERSIEMVIGILGILKAGGAYLPINPEYPEERIDYMLKDSGTKILVTSGSLAKDGEKNLEIVFLDTLSSSTFKNSDLPNFLTSQLPNFHLLPATSLAYINYTSGSTGKPKGVMVEHRNVVRLVKNTDYFSFKETHRLLQTGAVEFDASTFEIWGPLLNGAQLYLAPKNAILEPGMLKHLIGIYDISLMWMTAPLFNRMVDTDLEIFQNLGTLLVGGDVLSPSHISKLKRRFPHLDVINGYGPTENTTFSTTHLIQGEYHRGIPIGKPISNSTAYILDKSNHPAPPGVSGELLVGGDGVSRGYLNNPLLTGEKFVRHPLIKGDLLYKTGDRCRWLPDGNIEFLGRKDHQVKIRGYRVELGEIESQIQAYKGIKEAVVLLHGEAGADKYLCAYFVPEQPGQPGAALLKEYLDRCLPHYMLPAFFVPLEKLPLTPNGKVDRKALPEPVINVEAAFDAPANEIELKLLEIWTEVLNLDKSGIAIGVDTGFFQLGGQSLKATVLASKIHQAFDVKISLTKVFNNPTIRGLTGYIQRMVKERFAQVEPVEKKEYYVLSSAQKRLYILQQMELQGIAYNMPEVLPLEQEVVKVKLENTFIKLIHRHQSLRTSFHMLPAELVQKIHDHVEFKIEYFDSAPKGRSTKHAINRFIRPFDLSSAPLLRVGILKLAGEPSLLLLDMHHIVSDGVSHQVLHREFTALYRDEKLPPLRIQYKDFSQWQTSKKEKENIKKQKTYWLNEFAGEIPILDISTDYPRPAIQRFAGNRVTIGISPGETGSLKQKAREEGVTLYMLLLAITNILLFKLSSQEDIVIGSPVAGRRHADLEKIIGMFVNTLALRNFPHGEKTFNQFLAEVKVKTLGAFENQEHQFEDLVEILEVKRDAGRNPLFDIMFALQNAENEEIADSEETPEKNSRDIYTSSKFDMTVTALVSKQNIYFNFTYNTALFKKETIQAFTRYYKKIILSAAGQKDLKLSQIKIMSHQEKKHVLYDLNGAAPVSLEDKTIHRLFAGQVERTPDRIALAGSWHLAVGKEGPMPLDYMSITYKELNNKSDRLARLLIKKGSRSGSIVAVMTNPLPEMMVGIMALLKSGACYLPIDPENPKERNEYLLNDSKAILLLTQSHLVDKTAFDGETLNLEDRLPYGENPGEPAHTAHPGDPVYMIYTSGTAGKPKGVQIIHKNLVNYVTWFCAETRLTIEDRTILTSSFAFDLGYTSLYPSLLHGAQLHLLSRGIYMSPPHLLNYISLQRISYLKMTPSLFSTLVEDAYFSAGICRHLRLVVLGGEAIHAEDVEKALRICGHLQIMNHYGPTEATIGCIAQFIDPHALDTYKTSPTIGQPIYNTKVFILDRYLDLLPVGIAGELCLSGAGVARGYLNSPELTAERFVTIFNRSYRSYKSYIIYKTGDLARWQPNGHIEFLGRIDHQLKIRGYRIELGEIESRLLEHEKIKEAVVIAAAHETGNQYLCAYYVLDGERQGTIDETASLSTELKTYLSLSLPDYMVPFHYLALEKVPLTPNGKLDRKALPTPEIQAGNQYIAPSNPIEVKLVEIWSDLLGRDLSHGSIGIDDNFFALGGHSLRAIITISRVYKAFQVKVPLAEIFKTPTIRGIARYIKGAARVTYNALQKAEKKEYYPVSSVQKRLYILHQMDPRNTAYNMEQFIPLREKPDITSLQKTFRQLIRRHESFRTTFELVNGHPVQRIYDQVEFEIEYYDLTAGVTKSTEKENDKLQNTNHKPIPNKAESGSHPSPVRPFDLSRAPLLRVVVIKTPQDNYLLMVDMHHIISDGISRQVLRNDFAALYLGKTLPGLPIDYTDYCEGQKALKDSGKLKSQELYWQKELEGEIPRLNLPTDYPRPPLQSFAGSSTAVTISPRDTEALQTIAARAGSTLFMVLLTLDIVLLAKLTGQEDIIVGTPIAGRHHPDLENVVGMFVNTLALRNYPTKEKTFTALLAEVKERTLTAFENQDYQFEDLVEKIQETQYRDMGRNPIFDVMFVLQDKLADPAEHPAAQPGPVTGAAQSQTEAATGYERKTAKFDLTLFAIETGEGLSFHFEYRTALFKEETVRLFAGYFKNLVDSVTGNPQVQLKDLPMELGYQDTASEISGQLEEDFGF